MQTKSEVQGRSGTASGAVDRKQKTLDYAGFQRSVHLNGLDGLRAVAILAVLLHHVMVGVDLGWLNTFHHNGRYGVHLFFVISGFLICTLFLREERDTGKISLAKFYGRRVLRLMPLYYAVLLAHVILVLVLKQYSVENQQLFVEKLPSYLFYYSNWLPTATAGPFFCAWSLAVEEQFYLAFGLLMFLVPRRHVILAIAVALGAKAALFGVFGTVDAESTVLRVLFSYQEAILWGVLLAFALHQPRFYAGVRRVLGSAWVLSAVAVGLVAVLMAHSIVAQTHWDAELTYVLMTLLVAAVVIRPPGFLNQPWLAHIGKISYGMYLLHMIVFSVAKKLPGGDSPWVCFAVTTVGTIVAASLAYRYFESPIIRWYKQRLSPTAARKNEPAGESMTANPLREPTGQRLVS